MVAGPRKHLKRLNAPRHWMLDKLGGIWAPRPSAGPHKLRECIPALLLLRNRLKYALTRREVLMIMMRRLIKVDHKVRTDINYPCGFMDVISIERSDEHFRLLYDVKGQFKLVRVSEEEASFKLCRVKKVGKGKKATIGRNPFKTGQDSAIPYIVTHDGRTIRYPDPDIKVDDTVKFNIDEGTIEEVYKFEVGQVAMATRGANVGRVGVIAHIERHPGSFDIVHVVDKRENKFATRLENVFVIGQGDKPVISLPKKKGIHLTILEETAKKAEDLKKKSKKGKKKKSKN